MCMQNKYKKIQQKYTRHQQCAFKMTKHCYNNKIVSLVAIK